MLVSLDDWPDSAPELSLLQPMDEHSSFLELGFSLEKQEGKLVGKKATKKKRKKEKKNVTSLVDFESFIFCFWKLYLHLLLYAHKAI